jgi:hypothetical protein
MALIKGTNSYATTFEADAYFSDRVDNSAWVNAASQSKDQALVTATSLLDDLSWTGSAISTTQPLAFPRAGFYFDPRIGISVNLDQSTVPDRVVRATKELALHLLNNPGLLSDTGSVINLSAGSIRLDTIRTPSLIPLSVKQVIKPLLVNAGQNSWWRNN